MEPATLALIAKPAAELVGRLLKPLVKKIENEISAQAQVAFHHFFGSYTKYLDNAVERHSYFTSVVFKNEQRLLEDFYIPLTLVETREKNKITIIDYPGDEINKTQKLLIVDTAGMGKTTLLKYLFLKCVSQQAGIPIFVELRKLTRKQSLLDFILTQLSDVGGKCQPDLFFKLLASGDFVIFLDGYDEIPEAERLSVTAAIQSFIEKSPGNKFILTSREEVGLTAFAQFQRYTIQPLKKQEAYTLLRKYADAALAEMLIGKLDLPENNAIHEFLTNPLLTSLLFKSFEYKHIIPLKRHIFYRQVYESLYESHDLTKEGGEFQRIKRSGLDIDRLEHLLRALGATTYKASKTEFTKEEALDFIERAKTLTSAQKISSSNILHDITHAVPLLVVDGNYLRWSHRSIQEYFAAQYICKNTKGKHVSILSDYYESSDATKHLNLIMLCADIDRAVFDQSVGARLAEGLLTAYNESYVNVDSSMETSLINERRALTAGRNQFFLRVQHTKTQPDHNEGRILYQRMISGKSVDNLNETAVHYGSPGFGTRATKIDRFIQSTKGRFELPFISKLNKSKGSLHDEFPPVEFLEITDSPDNPFNHPSVFAKINTYLEYYTDWKFDPVAAQDYLTLIAKEIKAKQAVEPW
ncbi:NACHT domain-containing protein [Duganella sp. FT109W]|uniref:NACHT domain-containing protein n=1 Tax=Duganella margarita TaxID=2692170 RepID=A0ABW9WHD5_9BURK|nr:NACHT domain-containing protein [Duganella margarita]MYN40343.1 NACHT domain-containing protein [Duganella margarita]